MKLHLALLSGLIIVSVAEPLFASPLVYNDVASFMADTTTSFVETYSSVDPGSSYTNATNSTLDGISYSASYSYIVGSNYPGFKFSSGAFLDTGSPSILTFAPTNAFSVLVGSDNSGGNVVTISISGSDYTVEVPYETAEFFGFSSMSSFSSASFSVTTPADVLLDNVTFATVNAVSPPASVPEPTTLLLLLPALIGLCWIKLFRREPVSS